MLNMYHTGGGLLSPEQPPAWPPNRRRPCATYQYYPITESDASDETFTTRFKIELPLL